jgi:hypothetical protein
MTLLHLFHSPSLCFINFNKTYHVPKPLKLGLHAKYFILVEGPITAMTKYRVTASGKNKYVNLLLNR